MHVDVVLPCEHERQGSFEVVRWSETAILGGAPAVSGGAPRVGNFSEQVWGLSAERRHCAGWLPGRRRGRPTQPVTAFSTGADTSGWQAETQRAPGEEEIDLRRDDLHPESRALFVNPYGDLQRCQSGNQSW